MPLRSRERLVLMSAVVALLLGACTVGTPSLAPSQAGADPTKDKLAQVLARGTLVLWTDPDYAPQSFKVDNATRRANTKCAPNEMTATEMSGYDAETGKLVGTALGLEPCFVATPFDAMIAGSWGDRWDVAWGSGAITNGRLEKLYATAPYYSTPANFFVKAGSPLSKLSDLSGKEIGVCSGCTHQSYLERTLQLPGVTLDYVVENPTVVTYNSEPPGLDDTAAGVIDAFLCSEPVGLGVMTKGVQLQEIEAPAYYTYKSGYVDRDLTLAAGPFLDAVNQAIQDLHGSGRLKDLSVQFFKKDYASPSASFDLAGLNQAVR